jgi:hypothetical protein
MDRASAAEVPSVAALRMPLILDGLNAKLP